MAYRLHYVFQVRGTSAFFETIRLMEQLNEVAAASGLSRGRIMTQSFGPFNQIGLFVDFPDLATYERETGSLMALAEFRELAQKLDDLAVENDPGGTTMWEDISSEEG
jgi:hypothetical protein